MKKRMDCLAKWTNQGNKSLFGILFMFVFGGVVSIEHSKAAVTVSPEYTFPGGDNCSCDICVHPITGQPHVIWETNDGHIKYSYYTGSSWSTPEQVPGVSNVSAWEGDFRYGAVTMEIDSAGRVHVVYITNSTTNGMNHIYQKTGGGWSTPVQIHNAGTAESIWVQMAINRQNDLFVSFEKSSGVYRCKGTYSAGSDSWSWSCNGPIMSNTSHVHHIAMASDDQPRIIFKAKKGEEYEAYLAKYTGSAVQVTSDEGDVDCPNGVPDKTNPNYFHAIWSKVEEGTGHDAVLKYGLYTGSLISGTQIAETQAHNFCRMVIDDCGTKYVFMPRRYPPKLVVQERGEGPWSDPIPLGASNQGYFFFEADAHGNEVHVVYSNWYGADVVKVITYRKITGPPCDDPIHFTDITSSAGVPGIPQRGGHSAIWCDVDGDGLEDIYATNIAGSPNTPYDILYMNKGDGTFGDESVARGLNDYFFPGSHGAVFCDLDNDGDFDAFVSTTALDPPFPPAGTYDRVYLNDGSGYFTEIVSGIPRDQDTCTRQVLAGDIDGDGDVDLYATDQRDDVGWNPMGPYHINNFFINDGSAQFTPQDRGVLFSGFTQGAVFADVDEDGDLDLFEARWPVPTTLYINDGTGNFTDQGAARGLPTTTADNGINLGDIDNDGDLDLVIVGNMDVYANNGNGYFTLKATLGGDGGFMACLGDFDHDGDLDLYRAGGSVYRNDGNGNFTILPASTTGLSKSANGFIDPRGCGLGDFDNDGDLDIYAADADYECHLFRSNRDDDNYLKIKLTDCHGQLGALGAKVKVYNAGHVGEPAHLRGYRQVIGAYGYCGQDSPIVHFGLPNGVYDVHIRYLTGEEVTLSNITPGKLCRVNCTSWGCADSVSIDLGNTDVENGISRPDPEPPDGGTIGADIGGRNCRRNDDPNGSPQDRHFYFDVGDFFVYQGSDPELYITVDYYDTGSEFLRLQYDSPGDELSDKYKSAGIITLTDTNTWKQHVFAITDAYFGNRQNGGADFRILKSDGYFYLDVVEVSKESPFPEQASNPSPPDQDTGVSMSADLSWAAAERTDSYDVYFGTDEITVGNADYQSPEFKGNQTETTFELADLDPATDYYWRIDTCNVWCCTKGVVWSFTTGTYPGDLDWDGDVDLEDFGLFQACYSGSGFGYPAGCEGADLDPDGDVDLDDFAIFQAWIGGANKTPGG